MSTALRLLILEDDPIDAELEVTTLKEAGYTCQWERVETRAEFLARLDTPNYDAILVDYNLPTFDGLTALHLYLERGLDLPFIFVSGTMGEEIAIESLKSGATDYVLKDRLSRLGPVVKRALHEREEHQRRQKAEEELQKSQRLLNAIMDHSPAAIQVKDLAGRYLLINNQIETIFDLQRGDVIGKTPYDIFPQEVAKKFLVDDQDALKARTAVQMEEAIPLPDGIHTFIVLKFPLLDAAGEPYAVAGISTDVTERKRTEEALRRSDFRFRSLVEQTTDAVFCYEYDPPIPTNLPIEEQIHLFYEGFLAECNDAAAQSYGATRAEKVVGKKLTELFGTAGGSLDDFFRAFIQSDYRTVDLESTEVLADGTQHHYLNNGYGVLEDGKLLRVWGTFRDITKRKRAAEALATSEATLRSIFRVAPVGIGLVKDRVFQWTNDTLHQMLGYTAAELQGQSARMLYPSQEEYERVGRVKYGEIAERGTGSVETRWQRKDGGIIDIILSSTPIDPTDLSKGVTFTALDITERKQAEEAVKKSQESLARAQSIAHLGDWEWDMVVQKTTWSDENYRISGYEPGDLEPTFEKFMDTVHPDDRDMIMQKLSDIQEGKLTHDTYEYRIVLPDGTERWLEGQLDVIFGDDGQSVALAGTNLDITERVLSEQERAQAEKERERLLAQVQEQVQRVQQIVETVPEGVILLDAKNRVVLANPLGHQDLTILADTLVGGTLTRLGEHPLVRFLTSPPQGLWHEVSAEERTFQVIARPIETGPALGGWVLVVRDITQQREIERRVHQQERLAAVGQLAAGIAHDFNNIMAVISLYAGMSLRTVDLPTKIYERLETIDQQAHRASDLIQQILDFSRRAVLERLPMELGMFLKEQVKLLRRTLPENIEIDLVIGRDEYTVNADLTRVQQMIMNLATNARDSMPEGGQLHIGLEKVLIADPKDSPLPDMKPGEWVCITVADTGCGIPADVLPHIYDPFFTTKPVGMGTGLGLSQVYGIVKQHEGNIDVATQEGKGTTFAIYLPSLAQHQPEPVPYEPETLVQGQGQLILVVEDDTATRAALVDSLELLNYRVIEATNGLEALSIFEQHANRADTAEQIALVLSDMVMPEMGGKALLYALREKSTNAKIVLLTGHPLDEGTFKDLKPHGLQDWLLKPLSIERLSQVIAQALEGAKRP